MESHKYCYTVLIALNERESKKLKKDREYFVIIATDRESAISMAEEFGSVEDVCSKHRLSKHWDCLIDEEKVHE